MPVFATPGRVSDYVFKETPVLGARRKKLAVAVLLIGLFTPTLSFFSFPSATGTRVSWTGLDIARFVIGNPTQPLPVLHQWVEQSRFGVWDPFFLFELAVSYALMFLHATAIAISPLRRASRFAGVFGVCSALGALRSGRWPFADFISNVRADVGLYVLVGVMILLAVIPEWQSLDD